LLEWRKGGSSHEGLSQGGGSSCGMGGSSPEGLSHEQEGREGGSLRTLMEQSSREEISSQEGGSLHEVLSCKGGSLCKESLHEGGSSCKVLLQEGETFREERRDDISSCNDPRERIIAQEIIAQVARGRIIAQSLRIKQGGREGRGWEHRLVVQGTRKNKNWTRGIQLGRNHWTQWCPITSV
jgi:hypothetical protein